MTRLEKLYEDAWRCDRELRDLLALDDEDEDLASAAEHSTFVLWYLRRLRERQPRVSVER